jgi:hypothetical protein
MTRTAHRPLDELLEDRFGPVVAAEVVVRGMAGDVVQGFANEIRQRRVSLRELAMAARLTSTEFNCVFGHQEVPPLELLQRTAHALGLRLDLQLLRTSTVEAP